MDGLIHESTFDSTERIGRAVECTVVDNSGDSQLSISESKKNILDNIDKVINNVLDDMKVVSFSGKYTPPVNDLAKLTEGYNNLSRVLVNLVDVREKVLYQEWRS